MFDQRVVAPLLLILLASSTSGFRFNREASTIDVPSSSNAPAEPVDGTVLSDAVPPDVEVNSVARDDGNDVIFRKPGTVEIILKTRQVRFEFCPFKTLPSGMPSCSDG